MGFKALNLLFAVFAAYHITNAPLLMAPPVHGTPAQPVAAQPQIGLQPGGPRVFLPLDTAPGIAPAGFPAQLTTPLPPAQRLTLINYLIESYRRSLGAFSDESIARLVGFAPAQEVLRGPSPPNWQ